MSLRPAAFAIPGDITTPTGGYIYERRLLEGLRAEGREVRHLVFGAGFPDPTAAEMQDAISQLRSLDPGCAVILDGFVSATLDTQALAALRVPSLAMVHHPLAMETGLDPDRRARLFESERANLRHVAHVLVPSSETAKMLSRAYDVAPGRITIARPGVDQPRLARAPQDPPLILSVGIQHPRKGHDVLLKALARMTELDWHAVIAGTVHDAAHSRDLAALIDRLDLSGRVELRGYVPCIELDALYAHASIFALATRYEGYGLVFDEALVRGLPIVSCRTGAVPQTVPELAGRLVPPDDPEAFAEALACLVSDAALREKLTLAAQREGARRPGWDVTAHIVGAVIDAL